MERGEDGHEREPQAKPEIEAKIFKFNLKKVLTRLEKLEEEGAVVESKIAELHDTRFLSPEGQDISLRIREIVHKDGKSVWKWTVKKPDEKGEGRFGTKARPETEKSAWDFGDALAQLENYIAQDNDFPEGFDLEKHLIIKKERRSYRLKNNAKVDVDTFIEVERGRERKENIQKTLIEIDISDVEGVTEMDEKQRQKEVEEIARLLNLEVEWRVANYSQEEALVHMGILKKRKIKK